jgi:predicted acylesterase/phospholipase RssA
MNDNSLKQRALILQGGGSLGAYEVGVINVLYHWIKKDCNEDDNIFDIIAGTSIGAINAAIMTSHTIERRKKDSKLSIKDSWNGIIERLLSFWKEISSSTIVDSIPFYEKMWDTSHSITENFQNNILYWSNFFAYLNPFLSEGINQWLNFLKTNYELPATGEAARRFYSAKQFLFIGVKNVFFPYMPKLDTKFYYNIPFLPNNIWYNYGNSWLENTLTKYVAFPIETSFYSENFNDDVISKINNEYEDDKVIKSKIRNIIKQPRLLVVSVDIQGGATVSFDSYEYSAKRKCPICPINKEDKTEEDNIPAGKGLIEHLKEKHSDLVKMDGLKQLRFTAYDNPNNIDNHDHNNQEKHIIFYNEGIQSDHVMASASIPIFYNYRKLMANKYDQGKLIGNQERYFWDGILLSNTPLRELISAHTLYWKHKIGSDNLLDNILKVPTLKVKSEDINNNLDPIELSQIPDLEVYIVNIWPTKENKIPIDHDLLKDRENDIRNHDKTIYDEKAAELVTDYINLCKRLINDFGIEHKSKLINILKDEATSRFRDGKKRNYKDLLIGKFAIDKIIRIERKDDPSSISEKWLDLSKITVDNLIKEGIKDTVCTLIMEIVKSLDNKNARTVDKEKLFEILNDPENHDADRRNIIHQNFLNELENNDYDKNVKNDILKSVDALIEGLKLYRI